jgi:hypothetical protein
MRRSLNGAISRVERLARRAQPSTEDLEAAIRLMDDDELECRFVQIVEQLAGPFDSHETLNGLIQALYAAEGQKTLHEDSETVKLARRHWTRLHWFADHARHGTPELVNVERESCRGPARPFGLVMVFKCPVPSKIEETRTAVYLPLTRISCPSHFERGCRHFVPANLAAVGL